MASQDNYAYHHATQSSQQEWDDAISKIIAQIQQQSNITTVDEAIQSLILTGGQYASASVHAMYLQKVPESPGFTRKDVSVYLADLGDENDLLKTYFQLVHFGGLSIEDSLRLYYTELRLLPLMNKNQLNTLLMGLATAFKENGGSFAGDPEDCVRIYNAMIMLNDSLHNKNALGRARQTEQSFLEVINDRRENKVVNFDDDEMRRIYHNIQSHALDKAKSTHSMQRSGLQTHYEFEQGQSSNPNKSPKSYSKYGAPSNAENDDVLKGRTADLNNYGNEEPPQNSGGCCVIL
eukprot:CAMPEP_0197025326 /NCGR_PEP_ID=MMETSP1384-20130603/5701_1 /TAXON_ID=29189 /ORGANISM="Ammonia sp." /LENGTH=291 /DNA_ID=CAMNT_0042453849 /DNA_START=163 /DNA_END=1038 /DNA_ORIENTATION=-